LHVVHVVTRLLRAGSEENTAETCRWQAEQGHRVTLIHGAEADPWWREHPIPGVRLMQCPSLVHAISPAADARALAALRALFRQIGPDVIHTHQSKAGILGRLAAAAVPGAFVVHGIHIVPFEGVGAVARAAFIAAERFTARRTDLFIGVSDAVCRAYVANGIASSGQVACVRSGMDLDRFVGAKPPADWRALLRVAQGPRPLVVLMMAALEPRKRHVAFLQALAPLADRLPPMRLIFAGSGPEEQTIRNAVAKLGLGGRVVMAGHRPDPEALFALADIAVLTSQREGLPRVVVQALASGLPVVACDLPGLNEVVCDGVNGRITDASDPGQAVVAMLRLMQDETARARLSAGARATDLRAWALAELGPRTTALYGRAMQAAA
jgi:glycosyltransferase involved in cell wall biosynthesis